MAKKKKKNTKPNNWVPPEDYTDYFFAASDDAFKARHPWGYFFLVLLGITVLLLPVVLYMIFVIPIAPNSPWVMLGWIGGFIIGVGLFNFVAIIIKQYLGHLVSIFSFLIGAICILISLVKLGIL